MKIPQNHCFSIILSLAMMITACKKQETPSNQTIPPESRTEASNELPRPDIGGETIFLKNKDGRVQATLIKKGDTYLIGGDIILKKEEAEQLKKRIATFTTKPYVPSPRRLTLPQPNVSGVKRSSLPSGFETQRTALLWSGSYWPMRTIAFTIDPSVPNQSRITEAMAHWEAVTNLKFLIRTTQSNYIEFIPVEQCASQLGMVGGKQVIHIGSNCTRGNMIHEIGHAIGFYHEHTRSDRGNFINILWNNIAPGWASQFEVYPGAAGFQIGTFDEGSIMCYGSFDASINPNVLPTMTRLNGSTFFSQRLELSAGDIDTYNFMYNAPPIYVRVEYENVMDFYSSDFRYWTTADVYVRFYSNPDCTVPTAPSPLRQVWMTRIVTDLGQGSTYFDPIPATSSNHSLGNLRIRDYYGDEYGAIYDYNENMLIESQAGYMAKPSFVHP